MRDNCLLYQNPGADQRSITENVGLLGSPAFEIPRVSGTDRDFDPFADTAGTAPGFAAQNRSNFGSMLLYAGAAFVALFMVLLTIYAAAAVHDTWGATVWFSLLQPAPGSWKSPGCCCWNMPPSGFRRLQPMAVVFTSRITGGSRRYWKFAGSPVNQLFPGTPLRGLIRRLQRRNRGQNAV
ncbi:MAG: hypothetical protein R3E89_19475 [Thiolinea sp.]